MGLEGNIKLTLVVRYRATTLSGWGWEEGNFRHYAYIFFTNSFIVRAEKA